MARYRYIVADLQSGVIREEIPFAGVAYGVELNLPGSFTGTLPLRHPKATRANLDPNRTALFVEREGTIVWSGYITAIQRSDGSPSVQVSALGFGQYFNRRRIRVTKDYRQVDQFAIARDLIAYAQGVSGGNIGITLGTETSGILRDRNYPAEERKIVGEALTQLADVRKGFDFAFESAWEGGDTPVKRLRLYHPWRGRATNLVLEYGVNVTEYSYALDGTDQETQVDGLGAGDGPTMLIMSYADPAVTPLMDGVAPHKDVNDPWTLYFHAVVRLLVRRYVREIISVKVRATPETVIGAFIEGDQVQVRISEGIVQVNNFVRINGYKVNVSDEGEESIEMVLLPWAEYLI